MNSYQLETWLGWAVVVCLAPVAVVMSGFALLVLWSRRVLGGKR